MPQSVLPNTIIDHPLLKGELTKDQAEALLKETQERWIFYLNPQFPASIFIAYSAIELSDTSETGMLEYTASYFLTKDVLANGFNNDLDALDNDICEYFNDTTGHYMEMPLDEFFAAYKSSKIKEGCSEVSSISEAEDFSTLPASYYDNTPIKDMIQMITSKIVPYSLYTVTVNASIFYLSYLANDEEFQAIYLNFRDINNRDADLHIVDSLVQDFFALPNPEQSLEAYVTSAFNQDLKNEETTSQTEPTHINTENQSIIDKLCDTIKTTLLIEYPKAEALLNAANAHLQKLFKIEKYQSLEEKLKETKFFALVSKRLIIVFPTYLKEGREVPTILINDEMQAYLDLPPFSNNAQALFTTTSSTDKTVDSSSTHQHSAQTTITM